MSRIRIGTFGVLPQARRLRRALRASDHQVTRSPHHHIQAETGFTLIELVVVAGILIVLAGIGLVQYKNGKTRASEAVLKTDLFNIRDAIDQYYADKGMYPGTLDELVSAGYLRKVPDDPFTSNNATWQTTQSEPDASN